MPCDLRIATAFILVCLSMSACTKKKPSGIGSHLIDVQSDAESLQAVATQGDAAAQLQLGLRYKLGYRTTKSDVVANQWLGKAMRTYLTNQDKAGIMNTLLASGLYLATSESPLTQAEAETVCNREPFTDPRVSSGKVSTRLANRNEIMSFFDLIGFKERKLYWYRSESGSPDYTGFTCPDGECEEHPVRSDELEVYASEKNYLSFIGNVMQKDDGRLTAESYSQFYEGIFEQYKLAKRQGVLGWAMADATLGGPFKVVENYLEIHNSLYPEGLPAKGQALCAMVSEI